MPAKKYHVRLIETNREEATKGGVRCFPCFLWGLIPIRPPGG